MQTIVARPRVDLLLTQNINMIGAGWCAKLVVPAENLGTSLFHVFPPAGQNRGWRFDSFAIDTTANATLAKVFFIDTNASSTSGMGAPMNNM
jgi:hypothetical protein